MVSALDFVEPDLHRPAIGRRDPSSELVEGDLVAAFPDRKFLDGLGNASVGIGWRPAAQNPGGLSADCSASPFPN